MPDPFMRDIQKGAWEGSTQHFCFEALFDHGSDEHFIGHAIVEIHRSLLALEIDHRAFHARNRFQRSAHATCAFVAFHALYAQTPFRK